MKTKIQKWGNSLGVRLPKNIVEEQLLRDGTFVVVALEKGRIIIEPVEEKVLLQALLKKTKKPRPLCGRGFLVFFKILVGIFVEMARIEPASE